MTRFTWFRRLALAFVVIAGGVVALGLPDQQLTGAERLPLFDESDPAAVAQQTELHERAAAVARRIAYKEQLVAGLVERRYRFDEVAREFLLVISEDENTLGILRLTYAAPTDEARAALNVIDYVRAQGMPTCEQSAAVAHLQGEYRRLYAAQ